MLLHEQEEQELLDVSKKLEAIRREAKARRIKTNIKEILALLPMMMFLELMVYITTHFICKFW